MQMQCTSTYTDLHNYFALPQYVFSILIYQTPTKFFSFLTQPLTQQPTTKKGAQQNAKNAYVQYFIPYCKIQTMFTFERSRTDVKKNS